MRASFSQSILWVHWLSVVIGVMVCGFGSRLSGQSNPLPMAYHGRLAESGVPVSGAYDLRFTVFDASEAGLALGTVLRTNVMVEGTSGAPA